MAELIAAWTTLATENLPTIGEPAQHTKPAGEVHALEPASRVTLCSKPVVYSEASTPWSLVANSPNACPACSLEAPKFS